MTMLPQVVHLRFCRERGQLPVLPAEEGRLTRRHGLGDDEGGDVTERARGRSVARQRHGLAGVAAIGATLLYVTGVLGQVASMERAGGGTLFDPATAAAALVFFVLAMQCLPTLAITRRETGSWRWAGLQLLWMTFVAYAGAFIAREAMLAAGWT